MEAAREAGSSEFSSEVNCKRKGSLQLHVPRVVGLKTGLRAPSCELELVDSIACSRGIPPVLGLPPIMLFL